MLDHWLEQADLAPEESEKIRRFEAQKPFSLHWELKTLLYLGVLLLNAGLGYLIYDNIDQIGHAVIIAFIGAISAACFWYAFRHRKPFSPGVVESATPYFDYILLLGCLMFLVMEGYLQFQYQIFGERYGLVTFIPMVLFFTLAYFFDNRGVLSLAITALASWVGITLTPHELLSKNDFNSHTITNTGIAFGAFLCLVTFVGERLDIKKHFSLTYLNFGVHIGMIACLAGMIALDLPIIYFPLLCLAVVFFLWYARTRGSFYFLTVAVIYGYIGITYIIFNSANWYDIEFYLFYFLFSCVGVILFLTNYKRFIKKDAL
ncbi:MAG: DUF2157 domain-containing protein [Saprospiraceae bacterium]|nr:DUF2157 domain-containing protein [Saprospiraceae bacterium]